MESPRRSSLDFQEECKSEEVEAKRWMDRASRYLTEGRYESAIRLLEKTENVFPNCKNLPELMAVTQVCYAATWRACHCARPYTRKLPDWYHVLKVDERADFDTIKKRYRQLALLLHPDKNKHVNSEGAFKTITEAYACLSDKEKRDRFNLERRRSFCANCNLKAQLHAAGHVARPITKVQTPQTPKYSSAFSTPKHWESDSLQNLRERAKATVNNLEREWGSKTSKWMHQLAGVRQRYWNLSGSPTSKSPYSTMNPDLRTPVRGYEYTSRPKVPRSSPMSHMDSAPKAGPASKLDFSTFEVRRASTSDVYDGRHEKLEENLDLLLKRLRAEGSAAAKGIPLSASEFGVYARTPEAGHLLRPLGDRRKVSRSSSMVDRKCSINVDAGSGYAMCVPKGRCLSKKDPLSPTAVNNPSSTVHVECSRPKLYTFEHKGQNVTKAETLSREPVNLSTPGRSSSMRLENLYQSHLTKRGDVSKDEDFSTPGRSSSMRLGTLYQTSLSAKREAESTPPAGSRSIGRTASGSWTSRVKANPELFDDVFTTESPNSSSFRTPMIRRQTSFSYVPEQTAFVLRKPPTDLATDASPTVISASDSKLSSDHSLKMQKGSTPSTQIRRSPSTDKDVKVASRVLSCKPNTANAENNYFGVRSPLGSRSENVTNNLSSGRNLRAMNSYMSGYKIVKGRSGSQLEQLEDMEQQQKTEAINGILERLRAEAKTVAVSLDRLRENIAAENTTATVRV